MKQNNEEMMDFGTRQTGFRVPENYFNEFEAKMNALIDAEEQEAAPEVLAPKVSLWTKIKPALYMAACMLSFVLVFKGIHSISGGESREMMAAGEEQAIYEDALFASVSEYDVFETLYADNSDID